MPPRRIRDICRWRICLLRIAENLPDSVRRRIQDFDLSPNSPLNDPFSKFTSDDPREFPASAFLANSPAGEFAASLPKSGPQGDRHYCCNWGRSEMIATQHAVVQAKAYINTSMRRTANVAKLALRDAPIALRSISFAKISFSAQFTFYNIQIFFGFSLNQVAVSVLRQVFERAAPAR